MIHTRALRWIGGSFTVLSCLWAAACGGGSSNPPQQTPSTNPSISSVSVNPSSVTGGQSSQGTVTLNVAPTAGTTVALSSNNAAASVPSTVTVNSGATTNTFTITTTAVAANTGVTITGTLNGSASATLTLVPGAPPPPPPPTVTFTARLRVVSLSQAMRKLPNQNSTPIAGLGPGTENVCPVIVGPNGTGQMLDCEFDGSASTSPNGIRFYRFKWRIGNVDGDNGAGNDDPKVRPHLQNCTFIGGINTGGNQFINMPVTLTITDNSNPAQEASVTVANVSVFPNGQCGYAF